jgi:hypothetical protein
MILSALFVGDPRIVYAEFDDNVIYRMYPETWRSRTGAPWPYLHEYEWGCSSWTTASANFGVMEMYSNNNDCANSACSSSTTSPGGDVATNYDNALGDLSQASYIPNPGNGTNQSGDKPQEVLFIVTDGVEDEESGGSRVQQAINDLGNAPGGKSNGTNWCTTIKNRGIQIAILYTDYLPVPANSWYESWIAPIQSDIGPALQACASPGLFYDAAIGADLGQALSALFAAVTQSGHLTQ